MHTTTPTAARIYPPFRLACLAAILLLGLALSGCSQLTAKGAEDPREPARVRAESAEDQTAEACPPGTLPGSDSTALSLEDTIDTAVDPEAPDTVPNLDDALTGELEPADHPLTSEEQRALLYEPEIHFDLDAADKERVERYFTFFTQTHRKTFTAWLKRSETYLPYVHKVLKERGMPEELAYLPFVESGFNPRAYSRAGAAGMWQFMRYTGRKYGLASDWWIDERRDPFKATHAACDYLSYLYDLFDDWYLAMAAYNAGEGKIKRALDLTGCEDFFELSANNNKLQGRRRLRAETRNYVPKFLAVLKIVRNLESLGFEPLNLGDDTAPAALEVKGGTDLLALAKACGYSWDDFSDYNPMFRRYVSPPEQSSTVYLPTTKLAAAKEFLASPDSRPYQGYRSYTVRKGDSWYRISRNFGVPITVLKTVNKSRSNLLHPGQTVVIPRRHGGTAIAASTTEIKRKIAAKRGTYVIQKGDTLYNISLATGVPVKTIMQANGLRSAKRLMIGQKLYIPDAGGAATKKAQAKAEALHNKTIYQVRRGDTLWSIAKRFGVNHKDLVRWNNLSRSALIHPGDKLTVYVD